MKQLKPYHQTFCITCLNKKELLAHILQLDLDCLRDSSIEEIMNSIEGEIYTNIKKPSNEELLEVIDDYPKFIRLISDSFFTVKCPSNNELINVAINIDTSKNPKDFKNRASTYAQQVILNFQHYCKLHPDIKPNKFVSIWISLYPENDATKAIYSYRINIGQAFEESEEVVRLEHKGPGVGFFNFDHICLLEPYISQHSLFNMLHILFNPEQKARYEILESEYQLKFNENERVYFEDEDELNDLFEISKKIVEQIGQRLHIVACHFVEEVMKNLNLSVQEAMDALGISEEDRPAIYDLIKEKNQ